MSILSKWFRGSGKKLVREFYMNKRQGIEYRLCAAIKPTWDMRKQQYFKQLQARLLRDGVPIELVSKVLNEAEELFGAYIPSPDKIIAQIMAGLDSYMADLVGYAPAAAVDPI